MKKIQKQYPKAKRDLTVALLKELLRYEPETGDFFWREYRRGMSKNMLAGTTSVNGYWQIFICGKIYFAHRLAWLYVHGVWPAVVIDHIDENKLNNSMINLREASHAENINYYHSKRAAWLHAWNLMPAYHC